MNVLRSSSWKPSLGALAAAASLLLASAPASAAYTGLYVFGDSLSDNGNAYVLTGGAFPPDPYYQGRFSNGPVAVEYVASGLGLTGAALNNYAIGGARTGYLGTSNSATGMLSQLAGFQSTLGGGSADGDALYFVWGGANDLRDGFANNNVSGAITTAVSNLTTLISTLHSLGARNFLLPNSADLGLTPEARSAGAAGIAAASAATDAFNLALSTALDGLAASWADEDFNYVDATGAHRALTAGAPGNGYSNVTDACLIAGVSLCGSPSGYMYWDSIHPSAVTHQFLGGQMLAAVPEPESLLMMASGIGLLLSLRRKRLA